MQLKHTLDKKKNNEERFMEYIKNIQMSNPVNNRILVIQKKKMLLTGDLAEIKKENIKSKEPSPNKVEDLVFQNPT